MVTRNCAREMRNTESASRSRIACAPAADAVRCRRPLAAAKGPSAPRASLDAATTRVFTHPPSHNTVIYQLAFHDMGRIADCRLDRPDVAAVVDEGDIVRSLLPDRGTSRPN